MTMPRRATDRAADRVPVIGEVVDLDRYPLHRPDSAPVTMAIEAARERLAAEGCAVVPQLLRSQGLERLCGEARSLKRHTHYSRIEINPYFSRPDPALPARHPVNTFSERSGGFIPGDAWGPGSPTVAVYRWPPLLAFLARCLGVDRLHRYADPLACLTVNVLDPGQQFAWHYDTNDFAVTVLLDDSVGGGQFQYAPNIRADDDERFGEVAAVLAGASDRVRTLDLRPGDLQIFRGRRSLHRVTRVAENGRCRLAAILAYTLDPGVIGRVERTRQLFGRVTAAHLAAEHGLRRTDELMD
jgi:hypothetical protein